MKNVIRITITVTIIGLGILFYVVTTAATDTSGSTTVTIKPGGTPGNNVVNVNTNPSMNTTVTVTASSTAEDDNIVSAIYAKYAKESALIGTNLTVTSANGIVTINGSVTAQSQADQAVIVAKKIGGVKDVRSLINVTTKPVTNKQAPAPNY